MKIHPPVWSFPGTGMHVVLCRAEPRRRDDPARIRRRHDDDGSAGGAESRAERSGEQGAGAEQLHAGQSARRNRPVSMRGKGN